MQAAASVDHGSLFGWRDPPSTDPAAAPAAIQLLRYAACSLIRRPPDVGSIVHTAVVLGLVVKYNQTRLPMISRCWSVVAGRIDTCMDCNDNDTA